MKKILRSLKGNYTVGMKTSKAAVPDGMTLGPDVDVVVDSDSVDE